MTVPAGYGEAGQPIGLTTVAGYLGEPDLIAVGYAREQATADECLARDQVDFQAKNFFQALLQVDNLPTHRLTQFHQDIDIAGGSLLAPRHRAKHGDRGHIIVIAQLGQADL